MSKPPEGDWKNRPPARVGAGDLAEKLLNPQWPELQGAAYDLVETVNESPIYTLARLQAR